MVGSDKVPHTIVLGIGVYVILVFLLRISGKRTLSKWNSFDFIVTVAFGSTLATTLLNTHVTFLQSVTSFALLIGLQFIITFVTVRSGFFEKLIKAKPVLLLYKGTFIEDELKRERISKNEVLAAVRNHGFASLEQVEAVIMETNGSLSIISLFDSAHPPSALEGVKNFKQLAQMHRP